MTTKTLEELAAEGAAAAEQSVNDLAAMQRAFAKDINNTQGTNYREWLRSYIDRERSKFLGP